MYRTDLIGVITRTVHISECRTSTPTIKPHTRVVKIRYWLRWIENHSLISILPIHSEVECWILYFVGNEIKKNNSIIWRKSERLVCARFCRMAHKGNRVYEPKTAPMMQIVHELTQLSWVTLTGPSRCTKTPQTQNLWKSSETCLSLFCFQFQNQSPKAKPFFFFFFFLNYYGDMSVSFSSLKKFSFL